MKSRTGFVSNSSSSSFIVIGTEPLDIPKFGKSELNVPDDFGGNTEFGWEVEDWRDLGSRINFCYLQTTYVEDCDYLFMLEDVLKKELGVSKIEWNITEDYSASEKSWGYIDHQSNSGEDQNMEMFKDAETLKQFLFAPDSKIHTDNDNY